MITNQTHGVRELTSNHLGEHHSMASAKSLTANLMIPLFCLEKYNAGLEIWP